MTIPPVALLAGAAAISDHAAGGRNRDISRLPLAAGTGLWYRYHAAAFRLPEQGVS
jgi:hypothetical protein